MGISVSCMCAGASLTRALERMRLIDSLERLPTR